MYVHTFCTKDQTTQSRLCRIGWKRHDNLMRNNYGNIHLQFMQKKNKLIFRRFSVVFVSL